MKSLKLLAYAKVNLYLAVLDRREDGYHEIKSVIQNISIFDEITFTESFDFEVTSNFPLKPKENLVTRAALRMLDHIKGSKVKIALHKNIPVAAGLGGGSSDAAATLIGLNRLFKLDLSEEILTDHAKGLGADVPFFLKGGTALIEGIGEKVTPIESKTKLFYVIAKPHYGVMSHEAYHRFDDEPLRDIPPVEDMLEGLKRGDVNLISKNMANMLEPGVIKGHPKIQEIKDAAKKAGAIASMLSGSGSSVLSLIDNEKRAQKVANELEHLVESVYITEASERSFEEI